MKTPAERAAFERWKLANKDAYLAGIAAAQRKNPNRSAVCQKSRMRRRLRDSGVAFTEETLAEQYKRVLSQGRRPSRVAVLVQYDEILAAQKGMCAVCQTSEGPFFLDHNHVTGKVRGVLCRRCNTGLGHLRDSITFCLRAASYLTRHAK